MHSSNRPFAPAPLRAWVLLCALLNALGWTFSAFRLLNTPAYLVGLVVIAGVIFFCLRRERNAQRFQFCRLRRRFTRPFPAAYVVLLCLAALGGLLYTPNNYDALAYRTPRVLHWLAEGQWHWIPDPRGWLNTRSTGFEWVTAPILQLLKSDRPLFLISLISFLLLPGLVFSVFRRLGIRGRTAWHWMWLLPTAGCFVLQAGSIANDLFGAALALAAIDFALRARDNRRPSEVWFSIMAAGLMTAAKSSNLTLLLPWGIAVFPSWRLIFARPMVTAAVIALTALASFLPTAILNYRQCGDWTGLSVENAYMRPPSPVTCATHNLGLLVVQNLTPPIFPVASAWNRSVENALPEGWKQTLDSFADGGRQSYAVRELPSEEHAGFGFALTLLLLGQVATGGWRRLQHFSWRTAFAPSNRWRTLLVVSPFIALLAFMAKSGIGCVSRLIAPHYALLLPLVLLVSDGPGLVNRRWWRGVAWLGFVLAAMVLVVSPARPLFPAQTLLAALEKRGSSPILERARTVYTAYANRADAFAPLRALMPATARAIGFVTATDPETSLWRPIGSRRVYRLAKGMTAQDLAQREIAFVVVNTGDVSRALGLSFDEWVGEVKGTVVTNMDLKVLASASAANYAVVDVRHQLEESSEPKTGAHGN